MAYEYKRPIGALYVVPARKWRKFFAARGVDHISVSKVYVSSNSAVIHHLPNLLGLVFAWAVSPFLYVCSAISYGIPEANRVIARSLRPIKYGAFSSDKVYRSSASSWEKLMSLTGHIDVGKD